jgi:hypothetical protein
MNNAEVTSDAGSDLTAEDAKETRSFAEDLWKGNCFAKNDLLDADLLIFQMANGEWLVIFHR